MTHSIRAATALPAAAVLVFLAAAPLAAGAGDLDFAMGEAIFERPWVQAPSSTKAADGLGPLFNARSCAACHPGRGGGHPPEDGAPGVGFVLRLADDPVYGRQLQEQATAGLTPEGRVEVTWRDEKVPYPDGSYAVLRRPAYDVAALAYGPLGVPRESLSGRVAPPVRGLGLLERIPDDAILAAADPDDRDGDGIAGRPNWAVAADGRRVPGRFGLKAVHPTVEAQNSEAFSLDIGMSTPLHPSPWGDCTAGQADCRDAPHGDQPQFEGLEIPSAVVAVLTTYVEGLAPAGGLEPPADSAGADLFAATGCAACHRPAFETAEDAAAPHLSKRTIFPYTDLLLHDLGDGLADGVVAGEATGRDWRTAPLWGMARREGPDGRFALLHDGRARTVEEAILWHGGEGEAARRRFQDLPRAERERLVRFVRSL